MTCSAARLLLGLSLLLLGPVPVVARQVVSSLGPSFLTQEFLGRQVLVRGDVLLGGLFPIHEAGRNGSHCGRIKADQGVQRMAAMLFALDEINSRMSVLPTATLGAQILDTCSVDSYALEQTLEFINLKPSTRDNQSPPLSEQRVVRSECKTFFNFSQVSVMVASMLQLFKIAQVSYSSTGAELSEKPRFAYFSRVVPPDNLQATVMARVIRELDWTYVHAIADTGSYGERGMDSFRAAATELGICIDGDVHKISRKWTEQHFKELLLRMHRTRKARGVVMFVDEDNLRRLLTNLDALIKNGHSTLENYFWFVASDSWGVKRSVVQNVEHRTLGSITVAPHMRVVPGFNEYFKALSGSPENTFLEEYWQSLGCSSLQVANFGECFVALNMSFKQESYVPFVVDAVKIVAAAINKYIKEDCGHVPFLKCNLSLTGFRGDRLQQNYRNISLLGNEDPMIDANGDGIGRYDIFQIDERGVYHKVGKWRSSDFSLDVARIQRGLRTGSVPPVSVCSVECPRGHYRSYQDQTCCWACIPCDMTTHIVVNITNCVQCPLGEVPNANLDKCRPIPPVFLQWNSAWALIPAVFSLLGLSATIFVVAVFLKFSETPVVMASGRELCYCMLTGISLCYILSFVLVSKPTVVTCALSRLLIGLSMSAVYAAILTKTNRLARVFKPESARRPRFITPKAQVLICLGIVSVQLIGTLSWLIVDPPGTTIQFPTRIEAVLTCKVCLYLKGRRMQATTSHLLISLLYNIFLILACTIYAFKTRKIPENFNETRLIGFTMYSTSILWLSFGPIYFATQNNFRIQITSLCMCIALSGTVALACFFAPKVYIVLWQPYKNVRTRHSAVGRLVNQQMRFISQLTVNPPGETSSPVCTSIDAPSLPPARPESEASLTAKRASCRLPQGSTRIPPTRNLVEGLANGRRASSMRQTLTQKFSLNEKRPSTEIIKKFSLNESKRGSSEREKTMLDEEVTRPETETQLVLDHVELLLEEIAAHTNSTFL